MVISTDEYERLKSLEALFEAIQERKDIPLCSYIPLEALAKKFNIDVKSL